MRTFLFIISLCLYASTLPAHAGQLDDLESEATNSSSKSSSSGTSKSSSKSSGSSNGLGGHIAAGVAEILVETTVSIVGYSMMKMADAGGHSNERYLKYEPELISSNDLQEVSLDEVSLDEVSLDEVNLDEGYRQESLFRAKGDPILPMLRLSTHKLYSKNNIDAQLNRLEAGYGFFGVSHSQNILNEDGDHLKLSNTLIHYRMSFGNNFSWDLAYGRGKMNGNQSHDGSVFAMPIRARFNPDWHFEYYPVWSSYKGGSLAEHQFSFNYHYKYVGATVGYKTWSAGTTSINGFFAGVYLSF